MKDEMDILREIGTISAGQGSTALSEILGRRITLKVPALDVVAGDSVFKKISSDQLIVCVFSQILTGIEGKVLFLLPERSAFKLVDMCYKSSQEDKKSSIFTEMAISLIKEVGNVVISSFVGALSIMLKTLIIPSIPTLVNGPIQQILGMAISREDEYVLFIETVFEEPQQQISGCFYLVLDPKTIEYVQESCKKLLDSLNE